MGLSSGLPGCPLFAAHMCLWRCKLPLNLHCPICFPVLSSRRCLPLHWTIPIHLVLGLPGNYSGVLLCPHFLTLTRSGQLNTQQTLPPPLPGVAITCPSHPGNQVRYGEGVRSRGAGGCPPLLDCHRSGGGATDRLFCPTSSARTTTFASQHQPHNCLGKHLSKSLPNFFRREGKGKGGRGTPVGPGVTVGGVRAGTSFKPPSGGGGSLKTLLERPWRRARTLFKSAQTTFEDI